MPWKKKIETSGRKVKYDVVAYYELFKRLYIGRAFRSSVEECRQWLEENKTWPVPVTGDNVCKDALMFAWSITEIVETRRLVEKHSLKSGVTVTGDS